MLHAASHGGGLRELDQIGDVLRVGIEKVVVNTMAVEDPTFVQRIADRHGSSTVAVSIDAKKTMFGRYEVHTRGGRHNTRIDPVAFAIEMDRMGAGGFCSSIDRDVRNKGATISTSSGASPRRSRCPSSRPVVRGASPTSAGP